jgi:sugar lactone lactonase YvrE
MIKNYVSKQLKCLLLIGCCSYFNVNAQSVTTYAGTTSGYADGPTLEAQFKSPAGLAVTTDGTLYIADRSNNRIRKISPTGIVSTLAGSVAGTANGTGASAEFNLPIGVAVAANGNVFITDSNNHRIRKITPSGVVTTFAGNTSGFSDGTGTAAQFNYPEGIAIDASGNVIVSDSGNHRIRKITPAGVVTTIAGTGVNGYADGLANVAKFNAPSGLAIDATGTIYVAEKQNNRIRKINTDLTVSTLAGNSSNGSTDGIGNAASFSTPFNIAVDNSGNVFVTDAGNNRIRRITATGTVTTIAGSTQGYLDGEGTSAQFFYPIGIALHNDNTLYVSGFASNKIRRITNLLKTNDYTIEDQISVYPNPSSDEIYVDVKDLTITSLSLLDLNGRTLLSTKTDLNQLSMGNLTKGIYLLQIVTDKGTAIKKIVKK